MCSTIGKVAFIMDLKQALAYPKNDKNWITKCFIMSLAFIFPVGYGYMLRASRNAARQAPLPEWEDFGGLFTDGLRVMGICLGYFLPPFLIMFLSVALSALLGIAGSACAGNSDGGGVVGLLSFGVMIVGQLLTFLTYIACVFLSVVAYSLLMREGASLRECFNFGRVRKLAMANIGSLFMLVAFCFVIHLILCFIGLVTFGLGLIIALPYGFLAMAALVAQFANIAVPEVLD